MDTPAILPSTRCPVRSEMVVVHYIIYRVDGSVTLYIYWMMAEYTYIGNFSS